MVIMEQVGKPAAVSELVSSLGPVRSAGKA